MNRQEMTQIVNEELKHIPRGYDVPQGVLRYLYNMVRRRDLKRGKIKQETLSYCVDLIKKDHPTWKPEYDNNFFRD